MSRDKDSLLDIINAARQVLSYMSQVEWVEFTSNSEKQDAVLYRILVMGEATKRLSDEFRAQHPEISWKQIAGMRDVIAHEYDQLDLEVVRDVMQVKIPQLLPQLEQIFEVIE
jgi:uncharacterized protein with HEPN domain